MSDTHPSHSSNQGNTLSNTVAAHSRLENFPVSFFATVMGIGGLTLAWMKAHAVLHLPLAIGESLRAFVTVLYLLLAVIYSVKLVRYPAAVRSEFDHPIRQSFFPAASIGLILIAAAWASSLPEQARALWITGATLQLLLTLRTLNAWLDRSHYQITHANPAWFIPVVGNILVPIGGVHFAPADVSWFFFSIGLVFWLVLLTVVFYRLVFHDALPPRLMPTLFILVAPPAVGFVSYVALTGSVDVFARILYFCALFITLLLVSNLGRFVRLPFFISAWAYTFPLAALTVATLTMAQHSGSEFYGRLGWLLLGFITLLIALLTLRTLGAAIRGRICVPD